ncbi:MAG TPA: hypothetical protein VFS43_21185 [Polyangiaceae bacterium]|nr:hypothetical protein [Polyangiaceae bacterium]
MKEVDDFIVSALEASILVSPRDHGLTREELMEAGQRAGFKVGELSDGIVRVWANRRLGQPKLRLEKSGPMRLCADFNFPFEPEYRDVEAFEFIRRELQNLAAEVGEASAKLSRDVFVERGVAQGYKREALEVAITVTVLDEILEEKEGVVRHGDGKSNWILPSRQLASREHLHGRAIRRKWLDTAYPVVQDIIARRADGRHAAANPLDAFEGVLAELGHDRFRAWWVQKRHELRTLDTSLQPVAVTVLSAALAEAALSFVVPRAQASGLMRSIDVNKPRLWRFVDLIKGAKSNDPAVRAILDERSAQRCLDLNDARQRIHAGFLIDSAAGGPIPDLKPEQARDVLQTTDMLVRKVLEWLDDQRSRPATP